MNKILVLSDTHVTSDGVDELVDLLEPYLDGVERIVHAGDIVCPELLEALQKHAPVDAVFGNMDPPLVSSVLPERAIIDWHDRRIGLMHGWGSAGDLPRKIFERFCDENGKPEVDVVIFGHSHQPLKEFRSGALLLNPGSPTDKRWAPFCSVAVLSAGRFLDAEIIRLPSA